MICYVQTISVLCCLSSNPTTMVHNISSWELSKKKQDLRSSMALPFNHITDSPCKCVHYIYEVYMKGRICMCPLHMTSAAQIE